MGDQVSKIGLKRGELKLLPHDPEWEALFQAEKVKLIEVFGDIVVDIQHVGSTAIPAIPAKPIIDIVILVKSLKEVDKYTGKMEALGYQKKQENRPERMFFAKGPGEIRVVHLHVGDESTHYCGDMILFRDYLIHNPIEAQGYANFKQELAEKFIGNRELYTAAKEKFVQEMVRKARKLL